MRNAVASKRVRMLIYTHVLNWGGLAVLSPLDQLTRSVGAHRARVHWELVPSLPR
jgi:hypothetical protein